MVASYKDELCSNCKMTHIQLSLKVKAFLAAHPKASRLDIYQGTGVSLRIIDRVAGG